MEDIKSPSPTLTDMNDDESALPTIAEILASDHILSPYDAQSTVVKVGQFAVKYGPQVFPTEAETMRYLAVTHVPLPKVYGFITDPQDPNRHFIVMEYIEGQTLEKILPSLSSIEKQDVFQQLQEALIHLRSLQNPGYIGSIGRKPLLDGIFYTDPIDPAISGPFESQSEMNEGIIRRLAESCNPSYVDLLGSCVESTLQCHRTVFTHADLQPKNIIVRRPRTQQHSDSARLEISIIDWEMSGWYPEYWDFCTSSVWDNKDEWLKMVQKVMPVYPKEYLMLKILRSIILMLG